jgi:hypothetical protein
VGSERARRTRRELVHRRDELVTALKAEASIAKREHPEPVDPIDTMPDLERHR